MSIDISDLLKYGWMLLLAIVPKTFGSINTRFKNLEQRDSDMQEGFTDLQKEVAVINTKMDTQGETIQEIKDHMKDIVELVTLLRLEAAVYRKE